VTIRPYKTHDQRIDGIVVTFFEHAQFASLNRLATVVRDATDAIIVLDFDGNLRAWNPAAEHIYGYSEQEAMQRGIDAIVPEQDLDAAQTLLERVRSGERLPPQRVRRRTKDGNEMDAWATLSLLLDESGTPKALSSIESPIGEANSAPPQTQQA
jgi:two-component system CheB/CheR fusion protein